MARTAAAVAPSFTHVLLTRFNVATTYADPRRGIEEQWLRHRVNLFMKYCWPSIEAQQERRFHWLIFCNAESPSWFKEQMERLSAGCTAVYVEGLIHNGVYGRAIQERGLANAPYLITTRLDNDDALSSNYVRDVQQAFLPRSQEFVLFPLGLQLYREHLYGLCWMDNPFYSMIEAVPAGGELKTVLCCRHGDIYQTAPVRRLWTSSKWIEVIHEMNVSNSLRGWPRLTSRKHRNFPMLSIEGVPADSMWNRVDHASGRLRRKLSKMRAGRALSAQ